MYVCIYAYICMYIYIYACLYIGGCMYTYVVMNVTYVKELKMST